MYIDPISLIAGQPALRVRKFLKDMYDSNFSIKAVEGCFKVYPDEAMKILRSLLNLGYIEKINNNKGRYKTTISGNTVACASAAKPISRATAEKKLREFLQRVEILNKDDKFLLKTEKVVVFGSYLSNKKKINDIDIAISYTYKEKDNKRREELCWKSADEAKESGRVFRDFMEMLLWPLYQAKLFLKSRSRAISLHEVDELKSLSGPMVLVYDIEHGGILSTPVNYIPPLDF